ncbi:hypothetical protein DSAG12_02161 [Promethearchaeum syntrophicum]|uniref:Uncharacterized protein n=1 Tax=Promethearchaeum syntrophicum TaxID=2594042 RepID=A0A5B9DBD7_9ARCH|nr:hypothetical protein [Candidatus Prometheoarchaeum syntrophicum]QEE16331.1 hypothetical protein DSAG12_02161 [Candidatus Prometheoarchaeum syntrophicum]
MEWHEWVLWIIAVLGFLLSLINGIYNIKKSTPRLRITFEAKDSKMIILKNLSDEIFIIRTLKFILYKKKYNYYLFPVNGDFTFSSFSIPPKKVNYNDVHDFYELNKYIKTQKLKYPIKYKIEALDDSDKKYYSKTRILISSDEEKYDLDDRLFHSFFTAQFRVFFLRIKNYLEKYKK